MGLVADEGVAPGDELGGAGFGREVGRERAADEAVAHAGAGAADQTLQEGALLVGTQLIEGADGGIEDRTDRADEPPTVALDDGEGGQLCAAAEDRGVLDDAVE